MSVFAGSAAGQPAAEAERPTVDVYLLAGQSNMQGVGEVAELPATWLEPIEGVYFWHRDAFRMLDPGTSPISARPGKFGPELGFARSMRMLKPVQEIYLVKFYRSGQPLHHGWDGNQWVGGDPAIGRRNFYPGETEDDDMVGSHYAAMLTMARTAFAHLQSEGYEPVLRGVVWMQGEADAKNETSADEYAESLARLKRRIEEDLDSEPAPFVFGQVLAHEPALDRFTDRPRLRERMAQADMRSGDERAIEGVWMVPTEGMPLNNDTVHYNTEGMRLLGTAFGIAMVQAQHALAARANEDDAE
ncbi:hypothetical protein OT109_03060 [Phycisphaeraceae bacterium D3-23]